MKQVKLSDIASPQAKLPPVNSCWNCFNKQDIIMIYGKQKVKCFGTIKDFRTGCSSWSDGKDPWPKFPEGCEPDPKKYR